MASEAETAPLYTLINPCSVCSLDSMLEIWMGLQLLTASLAPIQEQRSTPFFISHQGEEILNALDLFPPMANHVCEWGLLAGVDLFLQPRSQTAEFQQNCWRDKHFS